MAIMASFGNMVKIMFPQILIFFCFVKSYFFMFLDCFDVLILKINF